MNHVPFLDLVTQYQSLESEIKPAMCEVLANCNFILGKQLNEFEHAFADFIGIKHALGVSSGLDALRLSLMSLNIGQGDEVILPANTYIATALAVSSVGARPVLIDCDPKTYNIDVPSIESKITSSTRAIMPVHLMGQASDMDAILEIARRYNLHIIEDAAQSHGTLYKSRPCGSMGTLGCFSFYPGKNLGAYGDGGMIVTNNDHLADRIRQLRNYGERVKYDHVEKGLNARLDTLQATILNVKLRYLKEWNAARSRHAAKYIELLNGVGDLTIQQKAPYSTHVYHLFIIETDKRDALRNHLSQAGIQTGIHYPKPIHLQQAYADLGYGEGDFPQAERLSSRILSLPMFPELTEEQIMYVVSSINQFADF